MTGYQRKRKTYFDLLNIIEEAMLNNNKVDFIQTSLIGALDVYKKDTQVSMKYSERDFHTVFDGRRQFTENITINKGVLLDTKPFNNKDECKTYRVLMSGFKNTRYHKYDSKTLQKPIRNTLSLCQRMFLRAGLENKLGLNFNTLRGLENTIDLLVQTEKGNPGNNKSKGYDRKVNCFLSLIASLKRKGSFLPKSIPFNEISEKFVRIIKHNIPEFKVKEFLEITPESLDCL